MTFQPPPPPPGPPPQNPQGQPAPPSGAPFGGPPPGAPTPGQPATTPQVGPPPGAPPQGTWAPPPQAPMQQPAPWNAGPSGTTARRGSSFDPKAVNPLDWGILGAGVLAFVFSFASYYTYTYSSFPISISFSINAWHGFFGWFAMLCALIGSAAIAVELFAGHVTLPAPPRLIALGAYAIATVCIILALFVYPGSALADTGHGFGYWISLIVIIAGLVMSYLRFTQTGGKLPIGSGQRP